MYRRVLLLAWRSLGDGMQLENFAYLADRRANWRQSTCKWWMRWGEFDLL